MRKTLLSLALAASFFFCCMGPFVSPALADRIPLPPELQFTQKTRPRENLRDKQYIQVTLPTTCNRQVNQEIAELADAMKQKARPYLPGGRIQVYSCLDVGPYISRTGSQWMSFLTLARIDHEREQIYVDFDARVYDMVTGERLALTDLFDPDSEAWPLLESAVRQQLTDYFITEAPDADALAALCARDALENAAFTLTPAKLELHYRADQLYPSRNTLLHVKLYYSQLRPLMNEKGRTVTDNSRYKMLALTYDDGGGLGASTGVLNTLQRYGANATFFIVGTQMAKNHHIMSRQHDAGFALASHNWEHVYENLTAESIAAWKQKFDAAMDQIVGIRPAYMRAPGGHYQAFINGGVGLPLLQWDVISGDAGSGDPGAIYTNLRNGIHEGAIMLMHDINPKAYDYTERLLIELEKRGILCVTIDEMFDHYGVALEPNTMYSTCRDAAEALP